MGWNSWDAYGTNVRENEVRANAAAMAELLADSGYEYVVVDHQWYDPMAAPGDYVGDWRSFHLDDYGRFFPDGVRFPSSAGGAGFKPLADYVHSLGLKFGVHLMRGVPRLAAEMALPVLGGGGATCADIADRESTCVWSTDMWGVDMNHPAGQAYYNSVIARFASWGVDFVKVDDMMNEPFHAAEISAVRRAIDACRRPMMLSLSPGGGGETWMAPQLQREADMWRISGDLWDDWKTVRRMFDLCSVWCWHQKAGRWPDADMLPLGRIGIRAQHGPDRQTLLTRDEQRTLMTLWCIFRSPLIMGGDLPSLLEDPWTLSLLTNPEVLAVNQTGSSPRPVWADGDLLVWRSEATGGGFHLALFNLGDKPALLTDFNCPELRAVTTARDLWMHQVLLLSSPATLAPHASWLLHIS